METTLQILVNSIVSGTLLSLAAIGFTYIFRVTKVFHLAHGGIYVAGTFGCWWVLTQTDNWFAAITFAFITVSVLIYLIEKWVYLPLSRRQSNQSISLIASMGLYVVIINVLVLLFGNENKIIEPSIPGSLQFGNIIFTNVQIIQMIAGMVSISLFMVYLKFSKSNLALQAVADNEIISKVFGINTEKERVKVLIAGSVLACIAAILRTLEVGIDPQAGMSTTLSAAVVAILVSRLNVKLIIIFSIILIIMQNTIEWFLDAQWKEGLTFFVLLLIILFRTEGIISYNLRKDRL